MVALLDDVLSLALQARSGSRIEVDSTAHMAKFEWAIAQLSMVNATASELVQTNMGAIAAIQAAGDRIDRLNDETRQVIDQMITGAVVR